MAPSSDCSQFLLPCHKYKTTFNIREGNKIQIHSLTDLTIQAMVKRSDICVLFKLRASPIAAAVSSFKTSTVSW